MITDKLITAAEKLRDEVDPLGDMLVKQGLVDYSYNPLVYAWEPHKAFIELGGGKGANTCLLYTSPSPRDRTRSRMPSSA